MFFVRKILILFCVAVLIGCGSNSQEISLSEGSMADSLEPGEAPTPTIFAPNSYMSNVSEAITELVSTPKVSTNTVLSPATKQCYSEKIISQATEKELKTAGVTPKNVGETLDKVIDLDSFDKKLEWLVNCMTIDELVSYFDPEYKSESFQVKCSIRFNDVGKVRTAIIEQEFDLQNKVIKDIDSCKL